MPHIVIDYSANLEPDLDLDTLFSEVHEALIALTIFPTGGIRSRARRIDHYRYADGSRDYAGIHVEVLLAASRPAEVRHQVGELVFECVRRHLTVLYEEHPYLALSLAVGTIDPDTFFNDNTIHQFFGFPE